MNSPSVQRRIAKGKQIMLSQSVDPDSGALNPTWVEWLMGWPLEWTDLKPLETDKSHCVQQPHGES
jgi:DNA (cytosine-5)-methyltransferase 1